MNNSKISRDQIWKIAKSRYPVLNPKHKDYKLMAELRIAFIKGMKMREYLELKNGNNAN